MEEYILFGPSSKASLSPLNGSSFGSVIYNSLKQHGNKVAQVDAVTGRKQTFHDILNASCILAANLRSTGLNSGDVISICSENRLEFTVPVIAALYIGVVCAPLNPAYSADELTHGLSITKPKMVFCSEKTLFAVCEAVSRCRYISEIVIFDENPKSSPFRTISYSELVKPMYRSFNPYDFRPMEFDQEMQTAVVLCSSGTTGLPKGVKLSHRNMLTSIETGRHPQSLDLSPKDTIMGLLPLFHGYGYGLSLISLVIGVKMILMQRFEERLFLSAIEKYKITVLPMVPPLMVFLAKHPLVDKFDLSSLKNVFVGAAPCGQDTIKEVRKRIKLNTIRQGYGMTELSLAMLVSPMDSDNPGSSGKLVPDGQGKVVDLKNGKALGPNCVGELCWRGPQVMQGYYENPEATAKTIDIDGWLHSGDIGYYDEGGSFYIVDRAKELIKYKGFQVAPAELEALILTLPTVKDVAVIGIPDEASGELPLAYVVKQPETNVTKSEIIKFVQGKVSSQKRLRGGVKFVPEIPRNPSGKILRRILREQLKSKL